MTEEHNFMATALTRTEEALAFSTETIALLEAEVERLREMRGPSAMEMLDVVRQFVRDGMSGEDAVRYGETWLAHWDPNE